MNEFQFHDERDLHIYTFASFSTQSILSLIRLSSRFKI